MQEKWSAQELKKIEAYDATQFDDWLMEGLRNWNEGDFPIAFMPLHNCFTIHEPIDEQLVELAGVLEQDTQVMFLEGLELSIGGFPDVDEEAAYQTLIKVRRQVQPLMPCLHK